MTCGLYQKSDTANTKSMKKPNQSLCLCVRPLEGHFNSVFWSSTKPSSGQKEGLEKMVLPNFTQNMEESFGQKGKRVK